MALPVADRRDVGLILMDAIELPELKKSPQPAIRTSGKSASKGNILLVIKACSSSMALSASA
jgi:hypothetical protein